MGITFGRPIVTENVLTHPKHGLYEHIWYLYGTESLLKPMIVQTFSNISTD
jgi:hypothetical protein